MQRTAARFGEGGDARGFLRRTTAVAGCLLVMVLPCTVRPEYSFVGNGVRFSGTGDEGSEQLQIQTKWQSAVVPLNTVPEEKFLPGSPFLMWASLGVGLASESKFGAYLALTASTYRILSRVSVTGGSGPMMSDGDYDENAFTAISGLVGYDFRYGPIRTGVLGGFVGAEDRGACFGGGFELDIATDARILGLGLHLHTDFTNHGPHFGLFLVLEIGYMRSFGVE